jgi:putative flippase GtrA
MLSLLAERLVSILPRRYQNTAKQFIKFAITGTIGAIVDFGTYAILTRLFGWVTTYTVLGTEIVAANNVSVFLAVCSNFIINRYWTFHSVEGNAARQGIGYFILNTFTWALNQILVSLFVFHTPLFTQLFLDQRDIAAKVAAIVIILFINFFGSKLLIFRGK